MTEQTSISSGIRLQLLGAMLLAFGVRSWGLTSQVFSNDEIIDLNIARSSWSAIAWRADGFPPLHHFLLKLTLQAYDTDMAARWLCLGFGILAIPIVGLLAQRVAGNRCGVLAGLILAISPLHVYFSQECRSYGLYFLATALATWLFFRAIQIGSNRSWLAFAMSASIGGYVHYYFCFVLLAFALIWLKQARVTGNWKPGLLAFLGMSVLQIPIFFLVGVDIACQQSMLQGNFEPLAIGYTGWTLLSGFCWGPSVRELHIIDGAAALRQVLPWLPLVAGLAIAVLISVARATHPYRAELLTLLLLPVVGAISLAAGFELSDYNVRYVIPSLVPLVVLLSVAIGEPSSRKFAIVTSTLLVLISLVSIANRQLVGKFQNEDTRSAANFILSQETDPAPVFTVAFYMEESARHYLPADYQITPIERVTEEPQTLEAATSLLAQQEASYWILYSREFHGDPDGVFKRAISSDPNIELAGTWEGVELYRGSAPPKSGTEPPLP